MLTFDNLTLDDLLSRAGQGARLEADGAEIESTDGTDPAAPALEIVDRIRREIPTLLAESARIDYLEIKFGSNPRVEIKFEIDAVAPEKAVIRYQASQDLDVPLSVNGTTWAFTYGVGYDFDPAEEKARFLADLGATQDYLDRLRARESSWAEALVADLALRFRKRRLAAESVAARISAMGYPMVKPSQADSA